MSTLAARFIEAIRTKDSGLKVIQLRSDLLMEIKTLPKTVMPTMPVDIVTALTASMDTFNVRESLEILTLLLKCGRSDLVAEVTHQVTQPRVMSMLCDVLTAVKQNHTKVGAVFDLIREIMDESAMLAICTHPKYWNAVIHQLSLMALHLTPSETMWSIVTALDTLFDGHPYLLKHPFVTESLSDKTFGVLVGFMLLVCKMDEQKAIDATGATEIVHLRESALEMLRILCSAVPDRILAMCVSDSVPVDKFLWDILRNALDRGHTKIARISIRILAELFAEDFGLEEDRALMSQWTRESHRQLILDMLSSPEENMITMTFWLLGNAMVTHAESARLIADPEWLQKLAVTLKDKTWTPSTAYNFGDFFCKMLEQTRDDTVEVLFRSLIQTLPYMIASADKSHQSTANSIITTIMAIYKKNKGDGKFVMAGLIENIRDRRDKMIKETRGLAAAKDKPEHDHKVLKRTYDLLIQVEL